MGEGVGHKEGVAVDWKKLLPPPRNCRALLPKRWVVKRSFSWISHNRRMSKGGLPRVRRTL